MFGLVFGCGVLLMVLGLRDYFSGESVGQTWAEKRRFQTHKVDADADAQAFMAAVWVRLVAGGVLMLIAMVKF